jgi:nucleotide-binding universal stress UspA family protein
MKILLAVDGSDFTKRMLAYLAAHDELLARRADFTVLTVVAPVPAQVTHFIDKETLSAYYSDQAEAVLKPIKSFAAQKGWAMTVRHEVGQATEVISRVASDGFDMLVLGSHGHTAFGSLVMGSVAAGVMARCKTPTLIIR